MCKCRKCKKERKHHKKVIVVKGRHGCKAKCNCHKNKGNCGENKCGRGDCGRNSYGYGYGKYY